MQQFGGPCFGAVASEGIFMKKFAFAVAAIALPASANAVPFVNGSFETGPATTRFTTLDPGSTAMTGWTVGGGGVDYIGGYWNAQNGSRSVDLSGGAPGSISQTFDTIAGQGYTVTFYLSGNGDNGVGPRTASVNATGSATTNYTVTASTTPNMTYTPFTYNFFATGASTTLTFASLTGNAYGPVLDNVAVTAVPEPATWGMMLLGFGAVGGMVRSRRRHKVARIRFA